MKLMYLAKRNPSYTSAEAFRPRWRQHGRLAMSMPSWPREGRYVQADAQGPSPVGAEHEFDGVGITWRESFHFGAGKQSEVTQAQKALWADELIAFDGPVRPRGLFVDESVLVSRCEADLTAYLFFEDADAAATAATTFVDASGPEQPSRVVLNRVSEDAPVPDPVYTFQGIVEVSAPSRAELDSLLVAGAAAGVRPDLEVVTQQCLLWNDGPVEELGRREPS